MSLQGNIAMETKGGNESTTGVDVGKFAVWLFAISISMIFAALSSAYIVRRAEGNWLEFDLPSVLSWSTLVIIISSVTLVLSSVLAKKGLKSYSIVSFATTLMLGILFLFTQLQAWSVLVDSKIFFGGDTANPAGSFIYVFTGLHGFHIVTGIIYLAIVLVKLFLSNNIEAMKRVIDKCGIYWHFLGALWIYLYLFLYLYN